MVADIFWHSGHSGWRTLIGFRSFRNGDPPRLAEIWRTRFGLRGYAQPMTAALLERLVMAKPYFDQAGLIVATDDGQPLGFAHAGFGPDESESSMAYEMGASILTLVAPHAEEAAVSAELIARCEQYLRDRGAKVLYGGGIRPLNAFYVGLYGGSELPGILDSDPQQQQFFRQAGYREIDRSVVLHRELAGFRPPVDREQTQLRRHTRLECTFDPPPKTWWEACTYGDFPRVRYRLYERDPGAPGAEPTAGAVFVEMESFSHTWGVRMMGLIDLWVADSLRRKGLATCLLAEALKQLAEQGVELVEAQTMQHNTAALALYRKLGFRQVDGGVVFRKE